MSFDLKENSSEAMTVATTRQYSAILFVKPVVDPGCSEVSVTSGT